MMRPSTRRMAMRVMMLAALQMMTAGVFALVGAAGTGGADRVVRVGATTLSDVPEHTLPVWVGASMLLAGLTVAAAGARRLD